MRVAVPREVTPSERRVALVPDAVARLAKAGIDVTVESGAGDSALFTDEAFGEAGAAIETDQGKLYGSSDVVVKVQKPVQLEDDGRHEVDLMKEGTVLLAFLQPLSNLDLVKRLSDRGITGISMDAVPRIARAQSMDALTSMASVAGYKAALMAANSLNRFMPMMMTAAGTLAPAKGLVLGAGVAGLQAIATARRVGAVMYGYDIRPAVEEQVKSLGANFIGAQVVVAEAEHMGGYAKELSADTQDTERQRIHQSIMDMDFVIATAAIPGRPAPLLITEQMIRDMRTGSVIVDVAAESGGNCELTRPGEENVEHGVLIQGPLNLPSAMPVHSSQMYSRNIANLLTHLVKDGQMQLDFEDEITRNCCITHQGEVLHVPSPAASQGNPPPVGRESPPEQG